VRRVNLRCFPQDRIRPRPAPDLPLKTLCGSPFEDFAVIATRPPRPDEVSGLSARVPAGLAKFPKAEN